MKLSIQGFLRAYKAEIDINPGKVVLLVGENGQGKTSAIMAAQAIFGANALPDGWDKKEVRDLMNDAVDSALIRAVGDTGDRQISYPECEVRTMRGAIGVVNSWALGLHKFQSLDDGDRASRLVDITKAKVTGEIYREALSTLVNMDEKKRDQLVLKALGNGPVVAQRTAEDWAKELKAKFKAITSFTWGANQGLTFKPAGWTDDLKNFSLEDLKKVAIEARKNSDDAVARAALDKAAAEHAGKKDEYAAKVAEWTQAIDETNEQLALAEHALAEVLVCEGCGMVGKAIDGKLTASAAPEGTFAPAVVKDLESRLANAQMGLGIAKSKFDAAVKAGDEVPTDVVDVAEYRRLESLAVDRVAAKTKKQEGVKLHYEIVDTLKASELVAPEGLSRKILLEALDVFNERLAGLCELAEWKRVWIDKKLVLRYGDYDYRRLSKAHKFRADATLQILCAQEERQKLVVFDEVEQLDRPGRNSLFNLLHSLEMTSMVALTTSRGRDGVMEAPNLPEEIGATYIMVDGVAQRFAKAVAA